MRFQGRKLLLSLALSLASTGVLNAGSLSLGSSVSDAVDQDSQKHNGNVARTIVPIVTGIAKAVRNGNANGQIEDQQEGAAPSTRSTVSSTASAPRTVGVKSIQPSGRVSGTNLTAQTVTCHSNKQWRIWKSNGQWWDGRGAQGGNSRSLSEQAELLCK